MPTSIDTVIVLESHFPMILEVARTGNPSSQPAAPHIIRITSLPLAWDVCTGASSSRRSFYPPSPHHHSSSHLKDLPRKDGKLFHVPVSIPCVYGGGRSTYFITRPARIYLLHSFETTFSQDNILSLGIRTRTHIRFSRFSTLAPIWMNSGWRT